MSLTSLLKLSEGRQLFREAFPFKPSNIDADISAPSQTKRYRQIDTAFDYLVRWWLLHKFPGTKEGKWVAESAVEMLGCRAFTLTRCIYEDYTGVEPTPKEEQIHAETLYPQQIKKFTPLYETGAKLVQDARSVLAKYVETGNATDELFRAAFGLAGLDTYYGSAYTESIGDVPDMADVDDLRRLWRTLESSDMCNLEVPLILNPTFGAGSSLVGGADADIISGDTLIDVKTTKFPMVKENYYHQLVGYWALSHIGGVDGVDGHKIGRLGIYFSRHGVLYTIPLPKMDDGFLDELVRLACRHKLSPITRKVGWREYVRLYDKRRKPRIGYSSKF